MTVTTNNPSSLKANQAALVKNVRTWVNQTFYGTLLKQMHNSPFKSEIFSGGRGGQVFSSLLDQHLTQRAGNSGATGALVNSIARRIVKAHPGEFGAWESEAKQHVPTTAGN